MLPRTRAYRSNASNRVRAIPAQLALGIQRMDLLVPSKRSVTFIKEEMHFRERKWSPISPGTTSQKVRKAPAATSVHHIAHSCLIPSVDCSSIRQVSSKRLRSRIQLLYGTRLYLDQPTNPHPAFGTLSRAGEGLGVRALRSAFAMRELVRLSIHLEMVKASSGDYLGQ